MRHALWVMILSVVAASLAAAVAYHYVGWIGVGIVGLGMVFVAVQAEMDDAVPTSSTFPISTVITSHLYRSTGRAETAERHVARKVALRATLVAKIIGGALAAAGCAGFFFVQVPHLT